MSQASQPPKSGGSKLGLIIILVVLVAALAVGGWFLKGYLDKQALSKRSRAQVEVVADFFEAMYTEDADLLKDAVSEKYADKIENVLGESGLSEGEKPEFSREWDGDVLTVNMTWPDMEEATVIELESDGDKEKAEVTVNVSWGEGEDESDKSEVTVEPEDDRWIVTEFAGESVESLFEGLEGEGEGEGASSSADEEACQANQRVIEGAVQQYLASDPSYTIDDLVGWVEEGMPLVPEFLAEAPACPEDGSYYYIYEDGTTECPSYTHAYYAD